MPSRSLISIETEPLLDALPCGILQLDQDERIVRWNRQLERWTGFTQDEVCGRTLPEIYPAAPRLARLLAEIRQSRQPRVLSQMLHQWFIPVPLPVHHISGYAEMQQECHLCPLTEPTGHLAITILDVTAGVVGQLRSRAQLVELNKARERAENAFQELVGHQFALDQHAIVAVTDQRGLITYVNDKFCEISGYARPELIGQNHRIINSGAHPQEFFQQLWRQISCGEVWRGDICNRTKSGALYWVSTTIVPLGTKDGKPAKYIAIRTDITERKQNEQALRFSKQRLELALTGADLGLWDWNVATGEVLFDSRWCAMLGFKTDELTPQVNTWLTLLHPDDAPIVQALLQPHLQGETAVHETEFRLRHKAGHWIWILARGKVMERDATGAPLRMLGTHMDLTARKQTEAALAQERFLMQALMASVPDYVYFKDRDSRFLRISDSKVREHGLTDSAQACGKTDFDFAPAERAQASFDDEQAIIRTGQSMTRVEILHRPGGVNAWVSSTKLPLRDEAGNIIGTYGISRDITALKENELVLQQAKAAADSASRAKSEFLATMSHEIRTPMNGVIGFTELLLDTPLDPQQRQFVDLLKSSSHTLLTVINDILDYSKIESGKVSLEISEYDAGKIVEDQAALFESQARSRGLTLEIISHAASSRLVLTDPNRLRQVLGNLLSNALKFTKEGKISIALATVSKNGQPQLRLSVTDTGIGIPREQQERLFQRFSQADTSTTRLYGGTGLGLAICRGLIELMGGQIGCESETGRGSTFWITLPQPVQVVTNGSRPPLVNPPPPAPGPSLATLVVEDNFINQELAKYHLRKLGCEVTIASGGVLALELMQSHRYDLVFMDCMMPEMDGYETTQAIRAREKQNPGQRPIPIIALTANAMPGDREKCLASGMDDYLSKPIIAHDLAQMIEKWRPVSGKAERA